MSKRTSRDPGKNLDFWMGTFTTLTEPLRYKERVCVVQAVAEHYYKYAACHHNETHDKDSVPLKLWAAKHPASRRRSDSRLTRTA